VAWTGNIVLSRESWNVTELCYSPGQCLELHVPSCLTNQDSLSCCERQFGDIVLCADPSRSGFHALDTDVLRKKQASFLLLMEPIGILGETPCSVLLLSRGIWD
jgi:hypothetical protein